MNRRYNKTNKLPMITTVVTGCDTKGQDQELAKGKLVNNTTSLGISDKQLGVLSWDFNGTVPLGEFITPGTTTSDVDAVKVLMGTPASKNTLAADPWEASDKAYVSSGVIHGDSVRSVSVHKAKAGRLSASSFTDFTECTADCNKEYKMVVQIDSIRKDASYGANQDVIVPLFTATDEIFNVTNKTDYVLQNILSQLNNRSVAARNCVGTAGSKEVVGFAINTAGGTGVALGTITEGTEIPFMSSACSLQGQPIVSNFIGTKELVRTLGALINAHANSDATDKITAASTIEVIDLSTAGEEDVNSFIVVGLNDDTRLTHDNDPTQGVNASTVQVEVTLGEGFSMQTPKGVNVRGEEPIGSGKYLLTTFNSRERLFIHTNQSYPSAQHFFGKNYIDKNQMYTTMFVEYFDVEDTLTISVQSPKMLKVLVPAFIPVITVNDVVTNFGGSTEPQTIEDMPSITTGCSAEETQSNNFLPSFQGVFEEWLKTTNAKFYNTTNQEPPYLT